MVLLCVGVIIAGTTYRSFATSYEVTARVNAELPNAPAIITAPADTFHTTDDAIDVSGSCPDNSYVTIVRDDQFAGVASCVSQTFQVHISLSTGANRLQAKVYNITDQEGPVSGPINVYRDPVPVAPVIPLATPTTLQIQSVEKNEFIPSGTTPHASASPTLSGFAPPFSTVTITYHSDPVTCNTKADGSGWWSCTLSEALPSGTHHVDVVAVTPGGVWLRYPTFEIVVLPQLPSLIPERKQLPYIAVDYRYQTHYPGQPFTWSLRTLGGTPPFKVSVNWGDGSESTIIRNDGQIFKISHAFPQKQTYTIFIKSVDANGTQTVMQLFAIVKGEDGAVATTTKPAPLVGPLAMLQKYLWIVWPAYIAVILMVLSYWLGEKEMYVRFMGRRLAHHGPASNGPRKGRRL